MKSNYILKSNIYSVNLVKISIIGLFFCSLPGCKKFVDIKSSSSQTFIESGEDCQLVLDDYATMNVGYPSDGEVSSDDYFLNDINYLSASLTATDRDLYIWAPTAIRALALPMWQTPYKIIYCSNLVLENIERLKGKTPLSQYSQIRGAALFYRAYSLFMLSQLYTRPYDRSNSNQYPGIPVRLSSDINDKSERGTIENTYSRIIQDLIESSNLLSTTSSVSSRPSKAACYGMLARVNLVMNNYNEALNNANLSLQINNQLIDYNTISKTSSTPFNPRFNKEVLFHSVMTPNPALNPASAGANVAKIDPSLIALYTPNDLRKDIFYKANSGSNTGTYRFTGNYEPVSNANLFNGIAVDELYLIRAECYARSGNTIAAMTDLNTLLRARFATGTFIDLGASTPGEALNRILLERRKELVMRGIRWSDLRRLNKDSNFAVTLTRTVNGTTYTLPPNDLRYTLLIPSDVINLTGIQQNPRN